MDEPISDKRVEEIFNLADEIIRAPSRFTKDFVVQELGRGVAELAGAVERARARLAETGEVEMEPGRWRRIRRPDGSLWMETSDGDEAQAEAEKTGWPLERQYIGTRTEWREVEQEANHG